MAEKEGGESSDSEAYLSADEGLTGSRGSEKGALVGNSEATKTGSSESKKERGDGEKNELESGPEAKRKEGQPSPSAMRICEQLQTSDQSVKEEVQDETIKAADVKQRLLESSQAKVTEHHQAGEVVEGGEAEKAPIPPPRRKRKKKLQRSPSLEKIEKAPEDICMQRSMTVGSVDMSRERPSPARTPLTPSSSLPPSHPVPVTTDTCTSSAPQGPVDGGPVEGGERGTTVASPDPSHDLGVRQEAKLPSPSKSSNHRTANSGGALGNSSGPPTRNNAPSISIEPDIGLELTEEMVHGQNKVITRDTLFAKASGSDKHETGIIFDSDDESLDGDGVYGSQELPDHSDSCPDGDVETRDIGHQSSEVVRGGGEGAESEKESRRRDQKEMTPLVEIEGGGRESETRKQTSSPSDNQILQMTIVKNLDTGDSFPLSVVDEKIPLGSPLNQHLYRRTAAMESHGDEGSGEEGHHRRRPLLKKKLKHLLAGKRRVKQYGEAVTRTREGESMSRGHVTGTQDLDTTIKYKPCSHHKGPYEFDRVRLKQDLTGPHLGAVWVMEFSICGRLLAVAGQDSIVRVWVLRTAAQFFHELQAKYQRFGLHSSGESLAEKASMASTTSSEEDDANAAKGPFLELPICTYHGHAADILDLSWSKNFFLLSSSMDKTVRLWHISRRECLCCFQHVDFVTAIAFHPRDDRYFLSGSLDGKLRLWNIPDKRVALWNEIEGVGSHLITAANFCMNGKLAVAGTYDGRCIFYETEHLKYHTQIHVRSRHGKNRGRKVSGIEPLPGEDKILVTSNDSRLRLYNLKDHSLFCKYKGGLNTSSQIRATFSRDGLNIISGSEDHFIYVWKTHHDANKLSSVRRDRNEFYESFSTHHAPVTAAVFAPVPGITVDQGLKEVGQMIIAADYQGCVRVYVNSEKL